MASYATLCHLYTMKCGRKNATVIPVTCVQGRHGKHDTYVCLVEDTGEQIETTARSLTPCEKDTPRVFFFRVGLPGGKIIFVRAPRQFQSSYWMDRLLDIAHLSGLHVYPVANHGITQIDPIEPALLTIDLAFKHRTFGKKEETI